MGSLFGGDVPDPWDYQGWLMYVLIGVLLIIILVTTCVCYNKARSKKKKVVQTADDMENGLTRVDSNVSRTSKNSRKKLQRKNSSASRLDASWFEDADDEGDDTRSKVGDDDSPRAVLRAKLKNNGGSSLDLSSSAVQLKRTSSSQSVDERAPLDRRRSAGQLARSNTSAEMAKLKRQTSDSSMISDEGSPSGGAQSAPGGSPGVRRKRRKSNNIDSLVSTRVNVQKATAAFKKKSPSSPFEIYEE